MNLFTKQTSTLKPTGKLAETHNAPPPLVELSPELLEAMARVERATAEQRRIEAALSTAKAELSALDGERALASANLSTVESEAALAGVNPSKGPRDKILALRDQLTFASAKVTGLEGRLQIAIEASNSSKRDLTESWISYQRSLTSEFLEKYTDAVGVFIRVLDHGRALALALEGPINKPIFALGLNTVVNKPYSSRNEADGRISGWKDNPQAHEIHDRVLAMGEQIRRHLNGAAWAPVPVEVPVLQEAT